MANKRKAPQHDSRPSASYPQHAPPMSGPQVVYNSARVATGSGSAAPAHYNTSYNPVESNTAQGPSKRRRTAAAPSTSKGQERDAPLPVAYPQATAATATTPQGFQRTGMPLPWTPTYEHRNQSEANLNRSFFAGIGTHNGPTGTYVPYAIAAGAEHDLPGLRPDFARHMFTRTLADTRFYLNVLAFVELYNRGMRVSMVAPQNSEPGPRSAPNYQYYPHRGPRSENLAPMNRNMAPPPLPIPPFIVRSQANQDVQGAKDTLPAANAVSGRQTSSRSSPGYNAPPATPAPVPQPVTKTGTSRKGKKNSREPATSAIEPSSIRSTHVTLPNIAANEAQTDLNSVSRSSQPPKSKNTRNGKETVPPTPEGSYTWAQEPKSTTLPSSSVPPNVEPQQPSRPTSTSTSTYSRRSEAYNHTARGPGYDPATEPVHTTVPQTSVNVSQGKAVTVIDATPVPSSVDHSRGLSLPYTSHVDEQSAASSHSTGASTPTRPRDVAAYYHTAQGSGYAPAAEPVPATAPYASANIPQAPVVDATPVLPGVSHSGNLYLPPTAYSPRSGVDSSQPVSPSYARSTYGGSTSYEQAEAAFTSQTSNASYAAPTTNIETTAYPAPSTYPNVASYQNAGVSASTYTTSSNPYYGDYTQEAPAGPSNAHTARPQSTDTATPALTTSSVPTSEASSSSNKSSADHTPVFEAIAAGPSSAQENTAPKENGSGELSMEDFGFLLNDYHPSSSFPVETGFEDLLSIDPTLFGTSDTIQSGDGTNGGSSLN